ncbi:hypothetical protein Tco_0684101 [Tanacetum coccineum]
MVLPISNYGNRIRGPNGRSENGQPLQSTLTSWYGDNQPSTNSGGNLHPNGTYLSQNAQPFIPNNLQPPSSGYMPIYVNPYPQPNASMTYDQLLGYSFYTQCCNPSFGGVSAYHPYGGYIQQALMSYYGPNHNGPMYPLNIPPTSYPFYAQPINLLPNVPMYPNYGPTGLFVDSADYITLFVRWIEDYPLLDGLKMPSHVGFYDRIGDPDNYLHIFEGAIRMQKWAMHVARHMFTYSLKDSAWIWWNGQKADKDSEVAQRATYFWFRIHVRFSKGQAACSAELLFTKWTSLSLIKYYKERPLTSGMKQRKWLPTEPQMIIKRVSTGSTRVALGITSKARRRIMIAIKVHTPCGIGTVFPTYEPNKVEEEQKKILPFRMSKQYRERVTRRVGEGSELSLQERKSKLYDDFDTFTSMDREVKRLKQSRIPIVKVRWNSRRGPEYTWEREDQMQKKYPHLFANPEPASQATS